MLSPGQGGGEEPPPDKKKPQKMRFAPVVKKKKDKKKSDKEKKKKDVVAGGDTGNNTAAFRELMEFVQSEASWKRGDDRSYRTVQMGSVAFGARDQSGAAGGQGSRGAWGGGGAGGGGSSGAEPSIAGLKSEVKGVKKGKAKRGEVSPREHPVDFSSYYPTFLPISGDPIGPSASERLVKDLVVGSDSEGESCNAAEELRLDGSDSGMMLFQLPGLLPVAAPSKEFDKVKKKGNQSAQDSDCEEPRKEAMKTKDLPGGRIGKLMVFKSGKVKMRIGDALVDVSPGVEYPFRQEVVAVNLEDGEGRGHCVSMGHVESRALCTLDMFQLLSEEALPDFRSLYARQDKPEEVETGLEPDKSTPRMDKMDEDPT
ncbi:hypothetical protein BSKO_00887 [Bryopsis sp. KO-2023]|nr:hypothetical protein BSKO_00887 [Bryopsis sp. KO-2023]